MKASLIKSTPPEVRDLLAKMLGHIIVSSVTDLHFFEDGLVKHRVRGAISNAYNLEAFTGKDAKLLPERSFGEIWGLLLGDESPTNRSRVYRGEKHQVRVQGIVTAAGHKILVRLQPLTPPPLTETLRGFSALQEHLASASGLVLVCGPIGGGKTTTAASIVSFLANRRAKHIATIEDPVEYYLSPPSGEVSHLSVDFLSGARRGATKDEGPDPSSARDPIASPIEEEIKRLVRCDINGLMIGEVRDRLTRNTCLQFAAKREPLITTFHAGGIADGIVGFTNSDDSPNLAPSVRALFCQHIHTILYVAMAYAPFKPGAVQAPPIPVVVALPGGHLRNNAKIGAATPTTEITSVVANLLRSKPGEGDPTVTPEMAMEAAVAMGATPESAAAALPPDITQRSKW